MSTDDSVIRHNGENGSGQRHAPRLRGPRPDPDAGLGTVSLASYCRGRRRYELQALIATGLPLDEIATDLGLDSDDIRWFAQEYQAEIAECEQVLRGQLAIEVGGLWIAKKHLRLAELQSTYDETQEAIQTLRSRGSLWSRAARDMIHSNLQVLRQVADELGAYPQRSVPPAQQGHTVHYVVEIDNPEVLR